MVIYNDIKSLIKTFIVKSLDYKKIRFNKIPLEPALGLTRLKATVFKKYIGYFETNIIQITYNIVIYDEGRVFHYKLDNKAFSCMKRLGNNMVICMSKIHLEREPNDTRDILEYLEEYAFQKVYVIL